MPECSLIISVFKKSSELKLIFYALQYQSFKNFEVIIADDGSGKDMENFITQIKNKFHFNIIYLTQEKNGFQKNKILNSAIKSANSDYLIFIDNDCIPNKDFVKEHISNKKDNTVLCGRRVMLGEKISTKFDIEYITSGNYEKIFLKLSIDSLGSGNSSKHIEEAIKTKNTFLRNIFGNKRLHLLGCNFSINKKLMERINGFDEDYKGAGIGEDTDIEYRLRLINVKFESVRNLAIVYHLYHTKTIEESNNYNYFHNHVKNSEVFFCKNGLIKTDD